MFEEEVIFDKPVRRPDGNYWSHMVAKDIPTLIAFAVKIGLKKQWLQDESRRPHFDIKSEAIRKKALLNGAKIVDSKYLVRYIHHYYGVNKKINSQGAKYKKPVD